MFTREEKRALLFLSALTVAGAAVRAVRGAGAPVEAGLFAPSLPEGDLAGQISLTRSALAQAGQRAQQPKRSKLSARAAPAGLRATGPAIATSPPPEPPRRIGGVTMVVRERRPRTSRTPVLVPSCPSGGVSINAASEAELACLPGIGPVLAAQIVMWRTAHGPFTQVTDLEQVPGIGPTRFQRLQPFIRAP